MRIALIIPSWQPEDIFPSKTASVQINYWQPLGTLYVASMLRNAGCDVHFLNGAFMRFEEIIETVVEISPEKVFNEKIMKDKYIACCYKDNEKIVRKELGVKLIAFLKDTKRVNLTKTVIQGLPVKSEKSKKRV